MRKWIDGNRRRIQAIERENAEYERRLSLRNSRMSRGSLDDRRRSQSSLLDAPLGLLGDTTSHPKTEVEPRTTMAFIKNYNCPWRRVRIVFDDRALSFF